MNRIKFAGAVLIGVALMLNAGCASKPRETGFLSSYKNLEPADGNAMRYTGPKAGNYSSFIIEPVEVVLYNAKNAEKSTQKDRDHLAQFFEAELRKELGAKYKLVDKAGPGVGRLRVAITDLQPSNPALNVLPQTKMTGMGLGQASAELEMVDSQTGEQIAAGIDSETGSRLSLSGLSKWGDVEAVMEDWAKRVAKRVDDAHGKT